MSGFLVRMLLWRPTNLWAVWTSVLLATALAAFVVQVRIAWANLARSTGALSIVEIFASQQIFRGGRVPGTFGLFHKS